MNTEYDYIVVGAGSTGCVLADKLSRSGQHLVLLLEAGGGNNSPLVKMPKGIAKLVNKPEYVWAYEMARERTSASVPEVWIRGKGLGGSSAINGMIWSRGQAEDYDAWERDLGCAGWNWANMNAALKAIEDHELGAAENRGTGGPVTISAGGKFTYPLCDDMLAAGEEMGLRRLRDLNDEHGGRVGYYSHNICNGRRVSGARAFLDPARQRPNLDIVTGATARRILFEGDRACGVDVDTASGRETFHCRGEIIVSGGTLESPRLLQLSGIGPRGVLDAAGVPVVRESPDVGRRMREHLSFAMPCRIRGNIGSQRNFMGPGLVKSLVQYQLFGSGALANGPFEVGAFARVGEGEGPPDLQLYLSGYTFALSDDNHPVPLSEINKEPGLSIYGQLLQLTSEGSLAITASDPAVPPAIAPNWLATEEDRRAAVATVRYMREYAARPALRQHIVEELLPGKDCQSDEDILAAFRKLATSGLHGVGTCRMGGDDAAVVDPRLRVRGVRGLRVADCSVMPGLISGNTNAPAMALGWRAADLILEDRGAVAGEQRRAS